jgi:hypothetical protein
MQLLKGSFVVHVVFKWGRTCCVCMTLMYVHVFNLGLLESHLVAYVTRYIEVMILDMMPRSLVDT